MKKTSILLGKILVC